MFAWLGCNGLFVICRGYDWLGIVFSMLFCRLTGYTEAETQGNVVVMGKVELHVTMVQGMAALLTAWLKQGPVPPEGPD